MWTTISRRRHAHAGNEVGDFLIAGPEWTGTRLWTRPRSGPATRYAWVLVQISADSPADFPAIHALQDQLKITPLSAWGKPYTPPASVPVDPNVDLTATPFDQVKIMTGETFFRRLAKLLKDNPPYPADSWTLRKLKLLGVEPRQGFRSRPARSAGPQGHQRGAVERLETAGGRPVQPCRR